LSSLASEAAVKPISLPCDLRDSEQLIETVNRFAEAAGGLDVLVNNAASDARHRWDEVTLSSWDDRLNVNLKQQFFAAQTAARHVNDPADIRHVLIDNARNYRKGALRRCCLPRATRRRPRRRGPGREERASGRIVWTERSICVTRWNVRAE
jgi:NAD(P)-dependent dehydrogenase (short-subunit alcohol dehydrogenase family)